MEYKDTSILEAIVQAAKEIKSWPKWKQSFCCLENDNTFINIDFEKLKDIRDANNK